MTPSVCIISSKNMFMKLPSLDDYDRLNVHFKNKQTSNERSLHWKDVNGFLNASVNVFYSHFSFFCAINYQVLDQHLLEAIVRLAMCANDSITSFTTNRNGRHINSTEYAHRFDLVSKIKLEYSSGTNIYNETEFKFDKQHFLIHRKSGNV